MSYHQTLIIGNVGRVDDLKHTQAGQAVLGFSVAVNETWTSNGEKQQRTSWYKCSLWGKHAETLAPYITKGKQVMCAGTVSASAWIDNDGKAQASVDLRVQDCKLLGGNGDSSDKAVDRVPDKVDIPF